MPKEGGGRNQNTVWWPVVIYGANLGSSVSRGIILASSYIHIHLLDSNSYTLKGGNNIAVGVLFAWWYFLPLGYCTDGEPWRTQLFSFDIIIKSWRVKPASQQSIETR